MTDSNGANTQRGRTLLTLREFVLKGVLPPGKRIEEVDLGRQLGVSRPILRSVLDTLASEGLLEQTPSGSYVARHFTLDDIRDTILARSTLEGLAASLAATRIQNPSELETARQLNAELTQALTVSQPVSLTPEQMSRFGELNAAFHASIVQLARSPMLSWYIERIQTVGFASPGAVVLPAEGASVNRIFEEHDAILSAIESRDPARAETLVKQHAHLAIHALESAAQGRPHSGRNIALELVANKPSKLPSPRQGVPTKRKEVAAGPTSERILDAAAELFCEKGFHAATTRELANRLNVQQASLYHHIRKKEDLLHRICNETMDYFLETLPPALRKAKDTGNGIGAFIEAHLQTTLQHPNRTLAMATEFRALSRHHFAEVAQKHEKYSNLLESELKAARASGRLRTDVAPKYMRLALLNILNWTPRWFRPTGALSCQELSSIYEHVFWEGVTTEGEGQPVPIRPVPSSSMKPRQRDRHRGTLGKFIRGAAELFAKNGYESTSTRNLATLLGMEKATLYYHLEGKEDLLYAICKSSIEQLVEDVNAAIRGIEDPGEQLQVWIQAHVVSLLRDHTQHATALAEVRALSRERLAEIIHMRKVYQGRIRSLIEAAQKAGRIRNDIAAKYLGLLLEGLLDRTVIWYRRSGELSPVEMAGMFCSLFFAGAGRRA